MEEQIIFIELTDFEGKEGIKVRVAGDSETLTKMLYSSMIHNPFLTSVVLGAANAIEKERDDYEKARLN